MSRVTIVGSYIVALVMDMERLPVEGETVTGRNFHTTHGGKGSNMAVAAARLGAEVHFLGKIGRDSHGQAFLALLQEEGVGARGVMTTDTSPTATGIIFFTDRGTNAIAIDRGANGELTPDDVARQRGLIGVNDIVISPLEISLATARAAAERASQQGGKAILNPAPAQDLRQEDLSAFFALTPNETEARVCLGLAPDDSTPDEVLADRLLDLGAPHVIITLGAQGALWASREGQRRIPALRVSAIDMVGAGDAFNAGLAVGLSEGRPLLEAICLGVTAASLSTEKRETIASYPRRTEVDGRVSEVLAAAERGRMS
ncbi:MAG TPA: ribokinase [Rhizomicrobium sp.]|jgi:ribokinase|nr:ribokinase [Rhizomicrobium sp.]